MYEEVDWSRFPVCRNILSGQGGIVSKRYQVDFLKFYNFKRCAAETILFMLNHIQRSPDGIIDQTMRCALELCIIFYLRGKDLDQDTQDLLALACLLQGAYRDYNGRVSDQGIWNTVSLCARKDQETWRRYYDFYMDKWLLNEGQLRCVEKYFWLLGQIDIKYERTKWPVLHEMIPAASAYQITNLRIPPVQLLKGPWPCLWRNACADCQQTLSKIEADCSLLHSTCIAFNENPKPRRGLKEGESIKVEPHYYTPVAAHCTPQQCKQGCSIKYKYALDKMKRCCTSLSCCCSS